MFNIITRASSAVMAAGVVFALAGQCAAGVIGFNSNAHGEIIDNDFSGMGVRFSAVNFRGGPDLAIVFDTLMTNTADPDLEAPWVRGNLTPNAFQRGILIIAENAGDSNRDGRIDDPDDQAAPRGSSSGEIRIQFDYDLSTFGFDLFDSEGGPEINPNVGYITFRENNVELRRVSFAEFITPTSTFYDPTIQYGDHSANRIRPMTAAQLNVERFDEVRINIASGGIDTITWSEAAPIPEPASVALVGMSGLALLRRRRA